MKSKNKNWKATVALIVGIVLIIISILFQIKGYANFCAKVEPFPQLNFFSFYFAMLFCYIWEGLFLILGIASIVFSSIIKSEKDKIRTTSKCCLIFGGILTVLSFLISISSYNLWGWGAWSFPEYYFEHFFASYSGSYGVVLILGIIAIISGIAIKIHNESKLIKQNRNSSDNLDALLHFKKLLDQGAITQEEFETKKKELLH